MVRYGEVPNRYLLVSDEIMYSPCSLATSITQVMTSTETLMGWMSSAGKGFNILYLLNKINYGSIEIFFLLCSKYRTFLYTFSLGPCQSFWKQ